MNVAEISTKPIQLACVSGVPIVIPHGIGRQLNGWLIVWKSVAGLDLVVLDPNADTSNSITLVPSATGLVRIVLL